MEENFFVTQGKVIETQKVNPFNGDYLLTIEQEVKPADKRLIRNGIFTKTKRFKALVRIVENIGGINGKHFEFEISLQESAYKDIYVVIKSMKTI